MRREITKTNEYPNFNGLKRHISSCLRTKDGNIIISKSDTGAEIKLIKTSVVDIEHIKQDKTGRRGFKATKQNLQFLEKNAIGDVKEELFMYCIHCIEQKLLPISNFTTNKTYKHLRFKKDSFGQFVSLQPFCKECKKKYVNGGSAGNKTRSKDQHLEDVGSRVRTKIIETLCPRPKINYKKIKQKYENKCFNCDSEISQTNKDNLDHTLPHSLYYSYDTDNCTLLCFKCNQEKKNKWPGEFYDETKLKKLSEKTGYDFKVLSGSAKYNEELLTKIPHSFDDIVVVIEKRFRKRGSKQKNKIFETLKKDMLKYSKQNPVVAEQIIKKIDDYLSKKEEKNE